MRLKAHFDVTGWEQTPYDEGEAHILTRVTVKKRFTGDLDGESAAELLMCQADADDPTAGAGYVGSELVTGSVNGKSGSFVMQHGGVMGPGFDSRVIEGTIIPGTGTGELAGLRGTVEITQAPDGQHEIALDVDLADV